MNLYIVRHGESTWNSQDKIQGHSDPSLSKLGILQARLLARRFGKLKIDRVYSSPLLRSLETARIVAKKLKLKIVQKKQLREVGLGEWEGKTPEEIDKLYNNSYRRWLKLGPTKVKIPNAESISAFKKRAKKVFYDIVRENKGRDMLVITHGGLIAAFLAHLLDADFDRLILSLHLPNTCVTVVSFYKQKGFLIHVADTLHLSLAEIKGQWPSR